jgi:hypothetical protein
MTAHPGGTGLDGEGDAVLDPVALEVRDVTLRQRVDVSASIVTLEPIVCPIRHLDVIIDDGTGRLRCRFFGRLAIPGVSLGRRLHVEGRVTSHLGRACVCNPDYELLGDAVSS